VILVGHSMGGPISLAAAKRLPGRVVAVVGVDTIQNAEYKAPEEQTKGFLEMFNTNYVGTMLMGIQGMLPENVDTNLSAWITAGALSRSYVLFRFRKWRRLDGSRARYASAFENSCRSSSRMK